MGASLVLLLALARSAAAANPDPPSVRISVRNEVVYLNHVVTVTVEATVSQLILQVQHQQGSVVLESQVLDLTPLHCSSSTLRSVTPQVSAPALVLEFTGDTFMPAIETIEDFTALFDCSPALPCHASFLWLSTRVLEVQLLDQDCLTAALHSHTSIRVRGALDHSAPCTYSATATVQFSAHGRYTVQMLTFDAAREIPDAAVNLTVLESIHSVAPNPPNPTAAPKSVWRVQGPLALSGADTVKLCLESVLPPPRTSFTVSLWLLLLGSPTGTHRTLFHKGSTRGDRTPSVWLLPDSNRLLLRASTTGSMDAGAESLVPIPLNQWTHLAIAFSAIPPPHASTSVVNQDGYDGSGGYKCEMSLYVNGSLDIAIQFQENVLLNDDPIRFFHDVSHLGPRSVVRALELWDSALTASEVGETVGAPPLSETWLMRLTSITPISPCSSAPGNTCATPASADTNADTNDCSLAAARLAPLALAAKAGSTQALLQWGLLRTYGYAAPRPACPFARTRAFSREGFLRQDAGVRAMVGAVSQGSAEAAVALAPLLLAGLAPLIASDAALDHVPLSSALKLSLSQSDSVFSLLMQVCGNASVSGVDERVSSLAVGLLLYAALHDDSEARAILSNLFETGQGVSRDAETAAFYGMSAAQRAATEFHSLGGEPVAEQDRLNDDTDKAVFVGNQGDDDEAIQLQLARAREGHVPSMVAMGDLYYYGARGLARDQTAAREYFTRAGEAGSAEGLCGAAGMALKGEGGPRNVSTAIELYERAAKDGAVRALNGLGYMYFFGHDLPKNETKAYHYFLQAASFQTDGDSIFNTGYCLLHGLGVDKNVSSALDLFTRAGKKFGHFDSVHNAGIMMYEGVGVKRNTEEALKYIRAAYSIGSHHGWVRRGLDNYMNGHYEEALMCYARAAGTGHEIAQSNAAFVIKRKLLHQDSLVTSLSNALLSVVYGTTTTHTNRQELEVIQTQLLHLSAEQGNADSMVFLGHAYHDGIGVLEDQNKAIWWYSKATSEGHALSCFYIAVMHHFGVKIPRNLHKAARFYRQTLAKETLPPTFKVIASALLGVCTSESAEYLLSFVLNTGSVQRVVKQLVSYFE